MKKLIYIAILGILFGSCNEYQKALKAESLAEKYKLGEKLFDAGKYNKANRLFVQIVPRYRGRPEAEHLMFMYSMTFYKTNDYYTANYQFERFVSAYPDSEKLEEAAFLGAKSYYHLSPIFSKEQKETVEAIEKLQAFINAFPESEFLEEANVLVKELDYKLEEKAYNIALQYNKTVPYTRDYQAAISAFNKFLLDFPGTSFREDAMFYRLDSAFNLAVNSVEWKMEERLNEALTYYNALKGAFPETKFADDSDEMFHEINTRIESFKTKVN